MNPEKWTKTTCDSCGTDYPLRKSVFVKSIKHFCRKECYDRYRNSPEFFAERDGQRMARAVIQDRTHREVREDEVVHFIDDNPGNVAFENLRIFGSAAAHVAFHHFGDAPL